MIGRRHIIGAVGAALLALAACGDDEIILEGERLDLRADLGTPLDAAEAQDAAARIDTAPVNRAAAISLPGQVANSAWTHRGGTAAHRITHPALNTTLTRVWSADIGQGNTRRHRLGADPVASGGVVFTLDSRATVTATGSSGQTLWQRDVTRALENADDASGGGLALGEGQLFVATGFGQLLALDPASGATRWIQELDGVAAGAPAVAGSTVVVMTRDSRAFGVDTASGRIRWQTVGARTPAGVVGGSSPGIADGRVVLPFGSGQITALALADGSVQWNNSLAGRRLGSVFGQILDISGVPVVSGNRVYIGNSSGRVTSVDAAGGNRLWTADEGALGPVWPAGGSLFLVSDRNELLRISADTGERIWGIQLPFVRPVRRERRLRDIYVHYGPVLAGGRLIVASDDGLLRSFSPTDGSLLSVVELPGPAARAPIVAGRTLYVLTDDGTLHAFR